MRTSWDILKNIAAGALLVLAALFCIGAISGIFTIIGFLLLLPFPTPEQGWGLWIAFAGFAFVSILFILDVIGESWRKFENEYQWWEEHKHD